MPLTIAEVGCQFQWAALRFAHAVSRLREREAIDYVEFFEYCGVGYYAFVQRLFAPRDPGPGRDAARLGLHGLERRAMLLSEVILTPSRTYYDKYCREMYRLPPERVVVSPPPKPFFTTVPSRPAEKDPCTIG